MKASCCCSPIGDRRSRLEVGYGLEPILPDGLTGSILREMRTALRQGDYGDAMMAAAQTMGSAIAKAKNVELAARLPRRTRPVVSDSFPWPVLIGGVFFLLLLLTRGGRGGGGGLGILPWLILGNAMGGSVGAAAAAADSAASIPAADLADLAAATPWRRRFQQLVRTSHG